MCAKQSSTKVIQKSSRKCEIINSNDLLLYTIQIVGIFQRNRHQPTMQQY